MSKSLALALLSLACVPLLSDLAFAEAQTASVLGPGTVIFTGIRYLGWALAGIGVVYMIVRGTWEIRGHQVYEGLRDVGLGVVIGTVIFTFVMPQIDGFMAAASTVR
jgi:hypothetical protein